MASELGERSSIAVLPLLLLDKAADDQGLCLGFADALVSLLGNLSGVDVLPTSAVLNLPLELTPSEIASRLGVRFVVHGAIQMSKGQWRLSLEMFDAYLQRPSFTKKCDIDIDRLATLEDDIAKQISRALNRPYQSGDRSSSAHAIAEIRWRMRNSCAAIGSRRPATRR